MFVYIVQYFNFRFSDFISLLKAKCHRRSSFYGGGRKQNNCENAQSVNKSEQNRKSSGRTV